jgi:hypothetical protein
VRLTEYVCTHVFIVVVVLAADPDFDLGDYE